MCMRPALLSGVARLVGVCEEGFPMVGHLGHSPTGQGDMRADPH